MDLIEHEKFVDKYRELVEKFDPSIEPFDPRYELQRIEIQRANAEVIHLNIQIPIP